MQRKVITSTIDGCISNSPPKLELLEIYSEHNLNTFHLIIQHFWTKHYSSLDGINILKLATFLFKFEHKLKLLKINEPNLNKNAHELIRIYTKKTYKNIIDLIENILKSEREIQSFTNENGLLTSNGPNDLFDILSKTYNLINTVKISYIHQRILNMFYECITQYLIGVDCVISNHNIIIDHQYLIAVSNNCLLITTLLHNLVEMCLNSQTLTEQEINDEIHLNDINANLNLISQISINRFITETSQPLIECFNCNYNDLQLQNVLQITHETYKEIQTHMNEMIRKKCFEEILKLTLFYYVKLLVMSAHKKGKKVNDIITKIEYDKGLLIESYSTIVGNNLTKAKMKILDDVLDFLQISSYMISSTCYTLREYIGPSFNMNTVKALIGLRSDFSREEKKDAINLCKEVIDNYKSGKKKKGLNGFFGKVQQGNVLVEENDDNDNGDVVVVDKKEDDKSEMNVYTLDEFLKDDNEESQHDKSDEMINECDEDKEQEISDVVYEGIMKKKSHKIWQERFFQIKNGYLYWFKDKNSSVIQNKISLEWIVKIDKYKECKFMIVVEYKEGETETNKIYKFVLETEEQKNNWVNVLSTEIKRIQIEKNNKECILYSIKPKKKIIEDYYKLIDVGKERVNIKKRIMNSIQKETFFKKKQTVSSSLVSEVFLPSKSLTDVESKDVHHKVNEDGNDDLIKERATSNSNQTFNVFECSRDMLVRLRDCFKKKDNVHLSKNEGKEKLNPN